MFDYSNTSSINIVNIIDTNSSKDTEPNPIKTILNDGRITVTIR